jgi:hypothetical protein
VIEATVVQERAQGGWFVGAAITPVVLADNSVLSPARDFLSYIEDRLWLNTPQIGDYVETLAGETGLRFKAVK